MLIVRFFFLLGLLGVLVLGGVLVMLMLLLGLVLGSLRFEA